MKKFLLTALLAGSLLLTSCQGNILSSSGGKKNLEGKSYAVQVYGEEEAKKRIGNLDYEGVSFVDAIFSEKGKESDYDLLIVFYFKSMKAAEDFMAKSDHKNLAMLNTYVSGKLGENLKVRVGAHNNVAYAGSEASFAVAFPNAL